ncbi:hypothetical protein FHR87_000850 [Azomonas macrocytogenes]|uniref:Uncharacterized protein n=1 Tax=Azomonas macrocytogenes TaxID=69962 RepID=A0A839SYP5_AZOMA|nr:hypothetical protein [Azomonas macrocytogenes]
MGKNHIRLEAGILKTLRHLRAGLTAYHLGFEFLRPGVNAWRIATRRFVANDTNIFHGYGLPMLQRQDLVP